MLLKSNIKSHIRDQKLCMVLPRWEEIRLTLQSRSSADQNWNLFWGNGTGSDEKI